MIAPADIARAVDVIAACPLELRAAVRGLDEKQLETPYRDGGWTVRQVVHHLPDSHMNAYIRTKLGVTEDHPRIKPYDEALWSELDDNRHAPVELSLTLMDVLHDRWIRFLRSLPDDAFNRTLYHPENGDMSVGKVVLHYAWHGRHHVAHITSLRKRMGW